MIYFIKLVLTVSSVCKKYMILHITKKLHLLWDGCLYEYLLDPQFCSDFLKTQVWFFFNSDSIPTYLDLQLCTFLKGRKKYYIYVVVLKRSLIWKLFPHKETWAYLFVRRAPERSESYYFLLSANADKKGILHVFIIFMMIWYLIAYVGCEKNNNLNGQN